MFMSIFYADDLGDITMADWVINGVNGKIENFGMELFN